jgi:hypothetical protein
LLLLSAVDWRDGFAEQSSSTAQKAVQSVGAGWYNGKENSFNPPGFQPPADHPLRSQGWLARPEKESWQWPEWIRNWWSSLRSSMSGFGQWVAYLLWVLLTVAVLACIVLLLMHVHRSYRPATMHNDIRKIRIDPTRVDALPFTVQHAMTGDPLAQAKHLASTGNFDLAIIFLYGYLLLALDQARKLHLQKGKTNRMYLREMEGNAPLAALVESVMEKFEQVYFGKHSIDQTSFQQSWSQLDRFHQYLHGEGLQADSQVVPTAVAEVAS